MNYLNDNYYFTVAMFGRKHSGKMSFLLMMLDRNDITVLETFQNEDYYRVTYLIPKLGVFNVYKYIGFDGDLSYLENVLHELSSSIGKLDYIYYFIDSIYDVSDFDRRFIQRLREKDAVVFCIFNKRTKEDVNKAQLYIEQGNMGVNAFACNCVNRSDVMVINDLLEQYSRDVITLSDLTKFLLEAPKTVLFLDPITIGWSTKNIYTKYFQLFKAIADKNGIAIYMDKARLRSFLKLGVIKPDVLITGNKIVLNVDDLMKYI